MQTTPFQRLRHAPPRKMSGDEKFDHARFCRRHEMSSTVSDQVRKLVAITSAATTEDARRRFHSGGAIFFLCYADYEQTCR